MRTKHLLLFFNFISISAHGAGGSSNIISLETGIVYPSPWSAVRNASTAYGYQMGEAIDATCGTTQGVNNKVDAAVSFSYYLAQNLAGFGLSTEYQSAQQGTDSFVNRIAAGIGTDMVQAGFNVYMDITSWEFNHSLSLRFGKNQGLAVALNTSDLSTITDTFLLGIGYLQNKVMQIEVNLPVDTQTMVWNPSLELIRPAVSLSVLQIPNTTINVGISDIGFSKQGSSAGKLHAGLLYNFSDFLSANLTINKRYVWGVGITGKL